MSGSLYRVGRFAARNAVWVLAAWVVIAIGLVVVANSAGRPESDNVTLPGTDSQSATNLLDNKLPEQANGSVFQSDASLAQGQNMQAVESTAKSLSENQYVQSVVSPFDPQGASQITKDGKIAYLAVALKVLVSMMSAPARTYSA